MATSALLASYGLLSALLPASFTAVAHSEKIVKALLENAYRLGTFLVRKYSRDKLRIFKYSNFLRTNYITGMNFSGEKLSCFSLHMVCSLLYFQLPLQQWHTVNKK